MFGAGEHYQDIFVFSAVLASSCGRCCLGHGCIWVWPVCCGSCSKTPGLCTELGPGPIKPGSVNSEALERRPPSSVVRRPEPACPLQSSPSCDSVQREINLNRSCNESQDSSKFSWMPESSNHVATSLTPLWQSGLLRFSAWHKADKATIVNAIRTYAELDIRSFLDGGTEGPVRALDSLRWMSRQGQLNWPLWRVPGPPQLPGHAKRTKSKQPLKTTTGSTTPTGADFFLGCWLVGQGCLR